MTLVAGIDSSTQSCKVVVRDAGTGRLVRQGSAPHPPGTEIAPRHWWDALQAAIAEAGGLDGVAALAVGAQQHGLVALDAAGEVVRDALLWNDTRSAGAAEDLVRELAGGAPAWAEAVGSVPVASFTVTKLRWLAEQEPEVARRVDTVCLPHDWLTWRLLGAGSVGGVRTDRGDASGTGYWSPQEGRYRPDLLQLAFGRQVRTPEVLDPSTPAGRRRDGKLLGVGTGDNAAAALGAGAGPGDVLLSIGTSGVVSAVSEVATADPTGAVAGFADASGRFLPLACTLNASGVLDATANLLGVDHETLSALALSAPAGAGGLVFIPYLAGERTPNLPSASGVLHGLRGATATPAHLARAAVEGLLCGLAAGLDALAAQRVPVSRILLIGGGARSQAVRELAPAILGLPVAVLEPGEYVADGAARQAAWALAGTPEPPAWSTAASRTYQAEPAPLIREQYAKVWDRLFGHGRDS
ncbi:MAG: xylulokinase [Candidatus Dormibacteraceae bacterium]